MQASSRSVGGRSAVCRGDQSATREAQGPCVMAWHGLDQRQMEFRHFRHRSRTHHQTTRNHHSSAPVALPAGWECVPLYSRVPVYRGGSRAGVDQQQAEQRNVFCIFFPYLACDAYLRTTCCTLTTPLLFCNKNATSNLRCPTTTSVRRQKQGLGPVMRACPCHVLPLGGLGSSSNVSVYSGVKRYDGGLIAERYESNGRQ